MKYVHPNDSGTYIRVVPGKPHSPNPYQRVPYVSQVKNGKHLDKYGNQLPNGDVLEAHIPIEEFNYNG